VGEIVNLNRARKARAAEAKKAAAAGNRLVHGRTKLEKRAADVERARDQRRLDGHKRED